MIEINKYIYVILVLTFTSTIAGYTLQKCCPLHQQLDKDFETCIDLKPNHYYNISGSVDNKSKEAQPDIVDSTALPWWFPQDVQILSTDSLKPLSPHNSFLKGEFPLQVKYGVFLPCSFHTSQLLIGDIFLDDGTLIVYDDTESDNNSSYPSISYCVDRVNLRGVQGNNASDHLDDHIIKLCPCLTTPCVRKCCALGKLIKTENGGLCVFGGNVTEDWRPPLLNASSNSRFNTLIGKQRCNPDQKPILLNPSIEHQSKYWILDNGTIHVDKLGVKVELPYKDYCAEITEYGDGTRVRNLVYCERDIPIKVEKKGTLFGVLFVVGAVFLTATLLVYAISPALRSLHGNNLMAHTASFLVAYIAMAAGQLAPQMPFKTCVAIGFIIQFSFLAAFFWLNVMCIDISWTFSGLRAPQGSAKVRDRKKFRYYSLYAWGSSGLISLVTAIMEFTPGITTLKPDFGKTSCLFKEPVATLVYFYIPMALLLIINLALFLYTAARIIAVKRQTAILHKPGSSAYNKEKQRLILYVKLFLLMGLTWTTEIMSWAVGGPDYYWYLTDILNLLRAVFIFIIFCCKRQVFNLLRDRARNTFRLRTSRSCQEPSKQDNTNTSVHGVQSSARRKTTKHATSSSSLASHTQETVLTI